MSAKPNKKDFFVVGRSKGLLHPSFVLVVMVLLSVID
jgi:hypothetical protein